MNRIKKIAASCILILLSLASLIWISTWSGVYVTSAEVSYDNLNYQPVQLPFQKNHIGPYSIKLSLSGITQKSQQLRIYPDDEIHALSINGKSVSLSEYSLAQRRDYSSGFVINLHGLNVGKTNILEAQLSNSSNPAGFKVEPAQRISVDKQLAVYLILVATIFLLKRHLPINNTQLIIICLALLCCTLYLSVTDERTRTFDVFEGGGHRDYIEYLIDHKKLPIPGDGWEYHQPPLYYLIAAISKQALGVDTQAHGLLWGQLLSLFLWTVFLVSALACIRQAFRKQPLVILLASLTIALWPSGIIHSIRIGNDVAIYAFYSLSFYYTIKWWGSRKSQTLFWASLWMAAALLSKSNGLAIAGILGVLMLLHIYGHIRNSRRLQMQKSKIIRDVALAGGFFVGAITINFADNVMHYLDGTSEDWLLSNVSEMINPGLSVANDLKNYLIFDSATFLQYPFISTWDDTYGRQYFWNFLWRSSLSAEFFFKGEALQTWGIANGILLLLMLFGSTIYYLQNQPRTKPQQWLRLAYRNAPWIMALVFPFILLLAYRIKVPLSCNTDFRYIYPVLVAIVFFVAQAWRTPSSGIRLPIPWVLTLSAPLIAINSLWWITFLK